MMTELANRAVACKGWRWLPGMLTLEEIVPPAITLGWDAARVLHADEGEAVRVCTVFGKVRDIHDTACPDLRDPATVGALLALVREAGDDNGLHVRCMRPYAPLVGMTPPPWVLYSGRGQRWGDRHETEAAALVAALEAAP